MTRTDVMASSRPHTAAAASIGRGHSGIARRLMVLPVLMLLALAIVGPGTALAAEENPTYTTPATTPKETPPTYTTPATTPKETPKEETKTTPTSGTSPSKEATSPTTPAANETSPAKETSPTTKATTLPFTGFDLRWSLVIGLLLMGAGVSIVLMQRRQRRGSGS
jgi:uncharacterized surface anchored protein